MKLVTAPLAGAGIVHGGATRCDMVGLPTERGLQDMTFTVGETAVYPNHGAAVIEDIET